MKKLCICIVVCVIATASCSLFHEPKKEDVTNNDIWVSAYLASWKHKVAGSVNGKTWGNMFTRDIDWDAFTHLFYFSLVPNADGTLSEIQDFENVNPDRLISIIDQAHQHNKPVLITIGGFNTRDEFVSAYSDENRSQFIQNIINIVTEWGFDGVDLDIQPLQDNDDILLTTFINELYTELQKISTPLLESPLLTVAVNSRPAFFTEIQDKFDQINITTYNMSQPFPDWVAWHNTPLYNGGNTFPIAGDIPLPSIKLQLERFLDAGIERNKIGIGFSFYGYEWSGVSEPLQGWDPNDPPTIPFFGGTPYHDLHEAYNLENALWDNTAKVPYVSISAPETFVSFDNQRSIEEKFNFVNDEGIGGVIIWELAGGFRENAPEGQKDLLLQSVKNKVFN